MRHFSFSLCHDCFIIVIVTGTTRSQTKALQVVGKGVFFINYMSKEGPLVAQHTEREAQDGSKIIENTYIIYTPQIIKFLYHSNPNPVSLVFPNTQTLIHQRNSEILQQLADIKESKPKRTKIRIVSRNTTRINTDHRNSQYSSKRSSAHEKIVGLRVQTATSNSHSSHLQKKSQGPFVGCGWCGQVNSEQEQFLAYPSQIRMRTAESRLIEDVNPYRKPLARKSDEWIIQQEVPIRLNRPQGRRKIFNSVQYSVNFNHSLDSIQRSLTRRSIFQSYQMRSESQSLNKSFRKRSIIFSSVQKANYSKQSKFQNIKQIQIPLSILASWNNQRQKRQIDVGDDSVSIDHPRSDK